MALIKCPECAKQISDKATACPYCGLPAEHYTHKTVIQQPSVPQEKEQQDFNAKEFKNLLISFDRDHLALFSVPRYIDRRTVTALKSTYEKYYTLLQNDLILQYVKTNSIALQIDDIGLNRFITKMQRLESDLEKHNNSYVDAKLTKLKTYFDHIMDDIDPDIKLDDEQRRAVIIDDNHCLLVAGAGAGKTTTMAAKVKYLVEKQGIRPQDIIVISYTNKAVNELKERINTRLKILAKIATFHSFAFEIVRKAHPQPPEVNMSSYNIILDMLAKQIFDNKRLMRNLVLFMGYYFDLPEDIFQFKSLNEYHLYKSALDYETLKSGLGEYVQKIADRRSKSVRTITGEFLRSVQEVQIANLLYLNGIDYEYEKPYPYAMPKANKKYTPDFFISQGENEVYIEHYGLTEGMKSFILNPQEIAKYQKAITDKRALHKKNRTRLIETWSFYNDKQSLLDHLREALTSNGFILKPRNLDEVYQKIVETGKDKYIYKLVWFTMNFIEQFKTSGYDDAGFEILREKTDNVRSRLYLDIAEEVYRHYQRTLKESNQIDFADMINDANSLLADMEKQSINLSYKYIIIDEFQDIARQRFNLTKRLSDITHAKVVAVGDDWQSIYAFAGSDISLFTQFLELMGSGTELKITHTYRNAQELIDIAGNFVQKNSAQIKKQLISPKRLKDPIQLEPYNDGGNTYKNLATAVNNIIGKILGEFGENKTILLIGRYNFDLYKLKMTGEFEELYDGQVRSKKHPKAKLSFMTAHRSKGLGYDNVIILNMLDSRFGFPSQIEDDPIIKMVTHEDKSMPFAEERRLFYVALTRTKNRVYVAAPLFKPSRFIVELLEDYNLPPVENMNLGVVDIFRVKCPICNFPLRYQFNKNYGLHLYTCTNDAEVCDFMTNDQRYLKDIFKCPKCSDGYMVVRRDKNQEGFYGCTNYDKNTGGCKNTIRFEDKPQ